MNVKYSDQPGSPGSSQTLPATDAVVAAVTVIIPMRNEEHYIVRCLQSLMEQTYPAECYELIVVDGMSSDRSTDLVRELSRSRPQIRLLSNPAAIVPSAMNLGIRSATGDIIVRADAHTIYPPDYIENCVNYLFRTGADNVGGPIITVPAGPGTGAQLVAAILSNKFGVGNSQFRTGMFEGYVDTVPFGTFRKELFSRVGFFDESLVRNQDNELNGRIRQAGGTIYQTPALSTRYFPPDKFSKLVVQTYKNSKWHLFTLRQTRAAMGIRHFLPALFAGGLLGLGALSFFSGAAAIALAAVLAIYLLAGAYFSWTAPGSVPLGARAVMPFGFLIFHLAYGLGVMNGLRFAFRAPDARPIRP